MNRANNKIVKELVQAHIMSFVDDEKTLQDILNDHKAANYESVQRGNFLIYFDEQREFINSLSLNNNSGREFTDNQVFDMYVLLMNRELAKLAK